MPWVGMMVACVSRQSRDMIHMWIVGAALHPQMLQGAFQVGVLLRSNFDFY